MKEILFFSLILIKISISSYIKENKRNLQEKSNDIVILHTNDVHCGVFDKIGYDGLMLLKKQLQKKYNYVITVDAGDHIQGGTMGVLTKGEALIDIMNKIGYDVVTLGNHEFDYTIPQLESNSFLLNCGYISINYCFHKNKTARYDASKIIEKNNKKIGFIGVSTPETFSKTYLNTLYDSEGNRIYDFLTENKNQELYTRIQEEINRLKNEEKVDYIIILGHLGILGDSSEENTSAGVIKNIEGVNALIDGHSHKVYSQNTPDKNSQNVLLAQTGTKLANIGIFIIQFVAAATRRIVLLSDERKLLLHLARRDAALGELLGDRHRGDFERPQLVLARGDLGHKYLAPVGRRDLCAGWPCLCLALARDFSVLRENARKRSVRDFVPAALDVVALLVDLRLNLCKRCLALGKRILRGGKRLGKKARLLVEGIDLHGDLLELCLRVGYFALVALCELAVLLDSLGVYADDFVGAAIGVVGGRLARCKRLETLFELVHLGVEFLLAALRLGYGTRRLFNRLVDVAPVRRILH